MRGGLKGPIQGKPNRIEAANGDRCIRHGVVALSVGHGADSNRTIFLPCLVPGCVQTV